MFKPLMIAFAAILICTNFAMAGHGKATAPQNSSSRVQSNCGVPGMKVTQSCGPRGCCSRSGACQCEHTSEGGTTPCTVR